MNHPLLRAKAVRAGPINASVELWFCDRLSATPSGATRLHAHELPRVEHVLRRDPAALALVYARLLELRARGATSLGSSPADQLQEIRGALRLGHVVAYLVPRVAVAPVRLPDATSVDAKPLPPPRPETDFIDVLLTNGFDHPFKDEPYELTLQGGELVKGKLDGRGRLRKEGVPFGGFKLEFPNLFGMTTIRDGQRISDHGRGAPELLPAPPAFHENCEQPYGTDEDVDEDEDGDSADDSEWGADEVMPEDGSAAWIEVFDGPSDRDRGDHGALDVKTPVDAADLVGMTGCQYHLAVLYCVSLRLVNENSGEWVRKPLPFSIAEAGGKEVARGESKDGVVFSDETAMGDFTLEIEGKSYAVVASPNARFYDLVHITLGS